MRISDWSSDVCSSDLREKMTDKTNAEGAMRVDTDMVRRLAEMLSENDLSEIEVEDGGRKIVVKRQMVSVAAAPLAHAAPAAVQGPRSEEHTSELQSLMRISYAVFCMKKTNNIINN